MESFRAIQETVLSDLTDLTNEREMTRVHFIAASLGIISLALVADKFEGMSSATIVVGGSDLALNVWHGSRTRRVRQGIEEQGYSEGDLDKAWHELAPKTHSDGFKGKPVKMIISSTDTLIPTKYQVEMTDVLSEAGSQVSRRNTRMGHYAAVGAYCYFGKLP